MTVATKPLKIIFAGTPEFSAVALKALFDSPHEIIAIYTQPDRPAGRGRKLTASPVKELALQHNIPVYQPLTLRDETEQKKLAELNADVMVVVAYGLILPKAVLNAPRLGCINIHASLLPRWRGAAPIQRAIEAGDKKTGITIMQMDEGLDTGDMLHVEECDIYPTDTSAILHDRLAQMGAKAVLETLSQMAAGTAVAVPQDNQAAIYAHKIKKEDAKIDWTEKAEEIERKVRAFNPWPGCYYESHGMMIKIWEANVSDSVSEHVRSSFSQETQPPYLFRPGTVMLAQPDGITVMTKEKCLVIKKLQFPGGRQLSVADVLNAHKAFFPVGKELGQSSC